MPDIFFWRQKHLFNPAKDLTLSVNYHCKANKCCNPGKSTCRNLLNHHPKKLKSSVTLVQIENKTVLCCSHPEHFLTSSSTSLPFTCTHKTHFSKPLCVSRREVSTSPTWQRGGATREGGGSWEGCGGEGNEVRTEHLFSAEAVAGSTAVGVCSWAVGEDQEVFVATVHKQGPLTASFDVVGPCRRLALCADVTVIAWWVTVNAPTNKRKDRLSWGLIIPRPRSGRRSHVLWSWGFFCTPL